MERDINNNIILIGMSGVGKTTVGLELSKEINYGFIDIDMYIEGKMNKSIDDIFEKHGEEYFRDLEEKVLSKCKNKKNTIISTGAGIVTSRNIPVLKELGLIIYLKGNISTLHKNILRDKLNIRPLLKVKNIEKKLMEAYSMRFKNYELVSDYQIDVDNLTKEKIVSNIVKVI